MNRCNFGSDFGFNEGFRGIGLVMHVGEGNFVSKGGEGVGIGTLSLFPFLRE